MKGPQTKCHDSKAKGQKSQTFSLGQNFLEAQFLSLSIFIKAITTVRAVTDATPKIPRTVPKIPKSVMGQHKFGVA